MHSMKWTIQYNCLTIILFILVSLSFFILPLHHYLHLLHSSSFLSGDLLSLLASKSSNCLFLLFPLKYYQIKLSSNQGFTFKEFKTLYFLKISKYLSDFHQGLVSYFQWLCSISASVYSFLNSFQSPSRCLQACQIYFHIFPSFFQINV